MTASEAVGLLDRGGSDEGVAEGVETGAVSTTTGKVGADVASAGGAGVDTGAGTTTSARVAWESVGVIFGGLARVAPASVAAGTCANFLGDTGRKAGAAPAGFAGASAASMRFSSALRA